MTPSTRTTPPHARPSWFATAAQKVRTESRYPRPGAFVPWGTVHARHLGSARTACGALCLTWPIFFDVDVHEHSLDVCSDCRRVAQLDRPPADW